MEIITSLDNKKIKTIKKLQSKKYRDKENLFIIEGKHLVLEALKAGCLKEVLMDSEELLPIDIKKSYVTKEVLKNITNLPSPPSIIGVCEKLEEKSLKNNLLIIDGLQDPGNLGTIIRSAVAFNIDTIILGHDTVDLYNEKVLRSTQGMIFHTNIIKRNLKDFIPFLKEDGYQIIGTKVTHGQAIEDLKLKEKRAFIMGNEGQGVRSNILDICDDYVFIPMNDNCESLNVGVATGIILYELYKKGR